MARSAALVGYALLALAIGGPSHEAPIIAEAALAVHALPKKQAPVPRDVRARVITEPFGMSVIVERPDHLVALELGKARAAGRGEARLMLHARHVPAEALVWESTDLATLITVRGTLRIADRDRTTELAMSQAPHVTNRLEGQKHRCVAHRDAGRGFVASCVVSATRVRAANLGRESAKDDVWIVDGARRGEKVVRIALPLAGSADAGVIGYRVGSLGIAVRAEATRALEPQLALAHNEKRQPEPLFF